MFNKYSIIVTLLLCFILGCNGPQIYYSQLSSLNPGMSQAQVSELLKLAPLSSHSTTVEQANYRFLKYRMNNGVSTNLYLVAFKADKLIYWGYIDEFRRHPDPLMMKALDNVIDAVLVKHSNNTKTSGKQS